MISYSLAFFLPFLILGFQLVMWASKRTIVSSTTTTAPFEQALQHIHRPETLGGLNPLVVSMIDRSASFEQKEKPEAAELQAMCYTVTDRVPILGNWSRLHSFTADFTRIADGIDSRIEAGMGVKLHNKWRVMPAVDGGKGSVIEETIDMEGSPLLLLFVIQNIRSSRETILRRLVDVIEGREPAPTPASS